MSVCLSAVLLCPGLASWRKQNPKENIRAAGASGTFGLRRALVYWLSRVRLVVPLGETVSGARYLCRVRHTWKKWVLNARLHGTYLPYACPVLVYSVLSFVTSPILLYSGYFPLVPL